MASVGKMSQYITRERDTDTVNIVKIQHLHQAKIKFFFARSNSHDVD